MTKRRSVIEGEPEADPRAKIIDTYLEAIEQSIRDNRAQIKLVNFGTGSGKTHQYFNAVAETVQRHPDLQVVGVYVAPLREHLTVPASIKLKLPVYKLNSLDMKAEDEFVSQYVRWAKKILGNKEFWAGQAAVYTAEVLQDERKALKDINGISRRLNYISREDFGDPKFKGLESEKAKRDLNFTIEKFLDLLIKSDVDEQRWPAECLSFAEVFYPLHLLRQKSGIVMMTCEKFETKIAFFERRPTGWIKRSDYLDRYIARHSSSQLKFLVALDEQEDGYTAMLRHKIDIVSPEKLAINNALSSIVREFPFLLAAENDEQRQILNFLGCHPSALQDLQDHVQLGKNLDPELAKYASAYRELTSEAGNSVGFFGRLIALNRGLQNEFERIADTLRHYDENQSVDLNFKLLSEVFSRFENNRSLLIPQRLYSKVGNDLMNIFAHNNIYIYNIEPLKKLFLARSAGGHVYIADEGTGPSVAELIYAILAIRSQVKPINDLLANVLTAEDSQSRSLDVWSQQINKAQEAVEGTGISDQPFNYLNRAYVYQSYKSIINITEISRYQAPSRSLVDPSLREVSIGSTAILSSPECRIQAMLAETSNVVFLISATGGIAGDLRTNYDIQYLEDVLRDEKGQSSFQVMSEPDLLLCEAIRERRRIKRNISVHFFSVERMTMPNAKTLDAVTVFRRTVLRRFIESQRGEGWPGLGQYKRYELDAFVSFLFYLLEDVDVHEALAFTQTLRWIRQLVEFSSQLHHDNFRFERSKSHPGIYHIKVSHNSFKSDFEVKLIMYDSQFNSKYVASAPNKSYLDELVETNNQKILFVSAYQSASKGLNPIVRTRTGVEKDFDALVLLMDSYYTPVGPVLDRSQEQVTALQFAVMKNVVRKGDTYLKIRDFNQYLSEPEARRFQELQHQILLGKGIMQALGRIERRDYSGQTTKLFLNEESRKNLAAMYKYLETEEPAELRKLSVNNYAVNLAVNVEEQRHAINDYDVHVDSEIQACRVFQGFRTQMLEDIENLHTGYKAMDIVAAWTKLRDPWVFADPVAYQAMLQQSGLYPQRFPESLFYHNRQFQDFVPYVATVMDEGTNVQIVSDSVHGENVYPFMNRLVPDFVRISSPQDEVDDDYSPATADAQNIVRIYNSLIPSLDVFADLIPRPHYFYDVLYPSLAENFTERWIHQIILGGRSWADIGTEWGLRLLSDFEHYNKLFELFDLFYVRGDVLLCVDVKAWSLAAGSRLSKKTLDKAERKLKTIADEYPEFSNVRGLLLNLHAPEQRDLQHSPALYSGNLIYAGSRRIPAASDILRQFLFGREH